MLKTQDIKELLEFELSINNIKDSGYDLQNGRKYVELRHIQFECDNGYIFDLPEYPNMEQWYIDNYDQIFNKQKYDLIDALINNPKTRQAVISMSDTDIHKGKMICTMYMHIFLDPINSNLKMYNMTYIVHMRSSDCIEYRSDITWHKKCINDICEMLEGKLKINNVKIIWNADSLQLYDKQFKYI